jgi:hypothetical protein
MASPGAERPLGTDAGHTDSPTETAKEQAENLGERVTETAGELKRQAEGATRDIRDRAFSAADEGKNAAAKRMESVAHAFRVASNDLRDQGQPMVAEYSGHIAEGLESMAQSLGRRNVDELVEGIEDLARQRPVAFMGGAVMAGFALARFMKSSAARRAPQTRSSRAPQAWAGSPAAASPPGAAMPSASSPASGATPRTTGSSNANRESDNAIRG